MACTTRLTSSTGKAILSISALRVSTSSFHEPDTPPAPDVVDITLFLDDYKPVDGVMLPHHITRSIGGDTNEELTFKTIKVNPAFKADAFAK